LVDRRLHRDRRDERHQQRAAEHEDALHAAQHRQGDEQERGHDDHGRPLVEQSERPSDRLGQVAAQLDEALDDVVLEPPEPRVEA